jgi:ATP-dependent Clp protease ATP-binding subunit ClpB
MASKENKMSNVIGILFDELGSQIQCQIVRDLMILKGKWEDIEVHSKDLTTISIAQSLDIPITSQPPIMYIVYRVKDWPRVPAGVKRVNRDLKVTEADIAEFRSKWTGIPLNKLVESEKEKLLHLEDELHHRVVGQQEAVTAVADAIQRSRAGLSDPNRPIASFVFLGPTGVGKTELAKALAAYMFDTEEAMVRIDMSEYMDKHNVSRLIGAPPGYVGYEEGGQLTEAIRRRPYAVILFDEIEKAHPDVFNIFLQILDDGRVTDAQGRTVDFKNSIIIMTSNIGSQYILDVAGDDNRYDEMRNRVMEAMRNSFRPEFLNRLDELIIFHSLQKSELRHIVQLQVDRLKQRLTDRKISLKLSSSALDFLAEVGYDPVFGARPLKRAIQRELETQIAKAILRGDFSDGDTIFVDVQNERLSFNRLPAEVFTG